MSAQLKFVVTDQIITRTDTFQPVAKSQNYLRASFTFDGGWGSGTKIAIFQAGCKNYEMMLDENNECLVPWEALAVSGNIFVSVYCGDRITSSKAMVRVLPTGYTDNVDTTQDPTVDVYQALLSRMDTIDEHVEDSVESALDTAKASGTFDGNGISSAVLNNDYTLTLTFTDGTTYTTPSIRGAQGDPGEVSTADLTNGLATKIDLNQGASNSGKYLKVNESGEVVPSSLTVVGTKLIIE